MSEAFTLKLSDPIWTSTTTREGKRKVTITVPLYHAISSTLSGQKLKIANDDNKDRYVIEKLQELLDDLQPENSEPALGLQIRIARSGNVTLTKRVTAMDNRPGAVSASIVVEHAIVGFSTKFVQMFTLWYENFYLDFLTKLMDMAIQNQLDSKMAIMNLQHIPAIASYLGVKPNLSKMTQAQFYATYDTHQTLSSIPSLLVRNWSEYPDDLEKIMFTKGTGGLKVMLDDGVRTVAVSSFTSTVMVNLPFIRSSETGIVRKFDKVTISDHNESNKASSDSEL